MRRWWLPCGWRRERKERGRSRYATWCQRHGDKERDNGSSPRDDHGEHRASGYYGSHTARGTRTATCETHRWPSVPGRPSRADSDPVLGRLLPHRGLCCHLRAPLPGTASTPKGASAKTQGWRDAGNQAGNSRKGEAVPLLPRLLIRRHELKASRSGRGTAKHGGTRAVLFLGRRRRRRLH